MKEKILQIKSSFIYTYSKRNSIWILVFGKKDDLASSDYMVRLSVYILKSLRNIIKVL